MAFLCTSAECRIQGITEKVLYLTVRCKRMKIDGLKGAIERKMLEELISQAEKS